MGSVNAVYSVSNSTVRVAHWISRRACCYLGDCRPSWTSTGKYKSQTRIAWTRVHLPLIAPFLSSFPLVPCFYTLSIYSYFSVALYCDILIFRSLIATLYNRFSDETFCSSRAETFVSLFLLFHTLFKELHIYNRPLLLRCKLRKKSKSVSALIKS